jgi:AhpD family alkylhydroperoxidase
MGHPRLEGIVAARLEFYKLVPEGMAQMKSLGHYLNTQTGLEPVLLDLVRLLASLLNGCEYCIHLHTADLKKLHEPEARIAGLKHWRGASVYTNRERAAFAWTEAVTNIQEGHADDAVYAQVREHFDEKQTVDLTLAITTINAWNRLAISLGSYPGHAGKAESESQRTQSKRENTE